MNSVARRESLRAPTGQSADRLDLAAAGRGFLAGLDPHLIQQLTRSAQSAFYPRGSVISLERGALAALVASGMVRCYISAPDGRQMTIRYAGPGDLVGTLSNEPSGTNSSVQVVESAELIHLQVEAVRVLAAQHPALALALHDELSQRLPHAVRALAASAFLSVQSRVARDLVERAETTGSLRRGVRLKVGHQDLADATGSVREVVSRAMQKLREAEIIATSAGDVTILDPCALVRLARK